MTPVPVQRMDFPAMIDSLQLRIIRIYDSSMDTQATSSATPQAPKPQRPSSPAPRRLQSRDLLGQDRELEIEHAGQLYRLRLTNLGKLILTK